MRSDRIGEGLQCLFTDADGCRVLSRDSGLLVRLLCGQADSSAPEVVDVEASPLSSTARTEGLTTASPADRLWKAQRLWSGYSSRPVSAWLPCAVAIEQARQYDCCAYILEVQESIRQLLQA
jgi:hypothetical protein